MRERWEYILSLDEELLVGCVTASEWAVFLIKDADVAFCAGANLAATLMAAAAIETHIRGALAVGPIGPRAGLAQLIESAELNEVLAAQLHELRRFRNKWIHVNEPEDDQQLLEDPAEQEAEIEGMAWRAIRLMREILYLEQGL